MATPTIGIPYSYRDRVEAEHRRLGSGSKVQTMKHILDVYFGAVEPNVGPNVNAAVKTEAPNVNAAAQTEAPNVNATATTQAANEGPPLPATAAEKKPVERKVPRYYVIA